MPLRDYARINKDVRQVVEEVIEHIMRTEGVSAEITLEVQAETPKGFSSDTLRTVSENLRTLKIADFRFEKD